MPKAKQKISRAQKQLRWEDLVSTKPGTLAGNYLRRFWQPVYRAENLRAGEAKPIEIMSERFTLYRAERAQEHLGRSEVGVILFRKIWQRELSALAEGRPLKKWLLPQDAAIKFQQEPEKLHQSARG
jgi:hypothetical protein